MGVFKSLLEQYTSTRNLISYIIIGIVMIIIMYFIPEETTHIRGKALSRPYSTAEWKFGMTIASVVGIVVCTFILCYKKWFYQPKTKNREESLSNEVEMANTDGQTIPERPCPVPDPFWQTAPVSEPCEGELQSDALLPGAHTLGALPPDVHPLGEHPSGAHAPGAQPPYEPPPYEPLPCEPPE